MNHNVDGHRCLFIGDGAGDNHVTPTDGVFIIGDGKVGTDGTQDFIIAPVPSITENYELSCRFLKNYGAVVFLVSKYHVHLSEQHYERAMKALFEINLKCAELVFAVEIQSHDSNSGNLPDGDGVEGRPHYEGR